MTTKGQFFHVTLRTLDVAAARDFYASVLGVNGAGLDVVPFHEAAIAKGARPHWLSSYCRRSIDRASFLREYHVLERCLGSADAYRQSRSALVSHVTLE
jgi:hypothetical protein